MFSKLNSMLREAKKANAEVEIFLTKVKSTNLKIEKDKLKTLKNLDVGHVCVRVFIGKKKGIATSSVLDNDVLRKAIKIAENSPSEEYYYGLPSKQKYSNIKGINNPIPNETELRNIAKKAIKIVADKKQGTFIGEGGFMSRKAEIFFVNSNGIEIKEKTSSFSANLDVVAKKQGKISAYEGGLTERKVPDIEKFAQEMKKDAISLLYKKPLKEKVDTVIFYPPTFSGLLGNAFLSNFNAENIIKKRSLLLGKMNKKIISDKITLKDSGCLNGGISSGIFDQEGTKTQETTLIEKGVLKAYVNDFNTAKKLKMIPTGNSSFDGISSNNTIIESGKSDIFKEVGKALIVKNALGIHTSNSVTSAFSIKTDAAFLYEEGKPLQPINDILLSGRFIETLNNVVCVDKEQKSYCGFYFPLIAFKGITITS